MYQPGRFQALAYQLGETLLAVLPTIIRQDLDVYYSYNRKFRRSCWS